MIVASLASASCLAVLASSVARWCTRRNCSESCSGEVMALSHLSRFVRRLSIPRGVESRPPCPRSESPHHRQSPFFTVRIGSYSAMSAPFDKARSLLDAVWSRGNSWGPPVRRGRRSRMRRRRSGRTWAMALVGTALEGRPVSTSGARPGVGETSTGRTGRRRTPRQSMPQSGCPLPCELAGCCPSVWV